MTCKLKFPGNYAQGVEQKRLLLVGAVVDWQRRLSYEDRAIATRVKDVLESWGVPVHHKIQNIIKSDNRMVYPAAVRIMNIRPDQGREDFLISQEKAGIIVLCNIPLDACYVPSKPAYNKVFRSLTKSYTASAHHNSIPVWQAAIARSDANIVFNTNNDGIPLDRLNDGRFVKILIPVGGLEGLANDPDECVGALVRKDYLKRLETYLHIRAMAGKGESPLLSVCAEAKEAKPRPIFYDVGSGRLAL